MADKINYADRIGTQVAIDKPLKWPKWDVNGRRYKRPATMHWFEDDTHFVILPNRMDDITRENIEAAEQSLGKLSIPPKVAPKEKKEDS